MPEKVRVGGGLNMTKSERRFAINLSVAFALVAIASLPLQVYSHEYIHYLQAGCHIDNSGVGFQERMEWGNTEHIDAMALAYIGVGGCERPERVNEYEAYALSGGIAFLLFNVVGYVLAKRERRKFKRINQRELEIIKSQIQGDEIPNLTKPV